MEIKTFSEKHFLYQDFLWISIILIHKSTWTWSMATLVKWYWRIQLEVPLFLYGTSYFFTSYRLKKKKRYYRIQLEVLLWRSFLALIDICFHTFSLWLFSMLRDLIKILRLPLANITNATVFCVSSTYNWSWNTPISSIDKVNSPVMREAMMSGRIMSLSSLMNSSPG